MSVEVGKRVRLKSMITGKNVRIKDNFTVDGLGGEGRLVAFDVVAGSTPDSVQFHSVANPGAFLCIKKTNGLLGSGKGGKLCDFIIKPAKKGPDGAFHLKAANLVNDRKKNKKGKQAAMRAGICKSGKPKDSYKVGKGKASKFFVEVIGEADIETTRAVLAGTYTRAGDVGNVNVARSAENKRALLVGCNYPGTSNALRGCVNDVMMMRDVLINLKGFSANNIRILIDTDAKYERPTGYAIKKALTELVRASKTGDVLMFHFSGHGTQVPAEGRTESDYKDEVIVPTDFNLISDGDMRHIVEQLPYGVDFTFVSDCCHSGGILDHKNVHIGDDAVATDYDPFSSRDFTFENREITVDKVADELGKLSTREIAPTNIRRSLFGLFGSMASDFAVSFVDFFALNSGMSIGADPAEDEETDDEDEFDEQEDLFNTFFNTPNPQPPAPSAPINANSSLFNLFGGANEDVLFNAPLPPNNFTPVAGTKPDPDEQISVEKGILISGCQANQTSADVCPGNNPANAYGALTHTLTTILKQNPNITNEDLVQSVRKSLSRGGFTQKPGLECDPRNAKRPFVC